MKHGKLYRIDWEDAYSRDKWQDKGDIAKFAKDRNHCICSVIGWFVGKSKTSVVLSSMRSPGQDAEFSQLSRIPTGSIVRVKRL